MIGQISAENLAQQYNPINSHDVTANINKAPGKGKNGTEFKEILGGLISDVDRAQKEADLSLKSLAKGENTSVQDVVMKMEEADLSFKLMKEVRNKLLDAYKEIMSMQA